MGGESFLRIVECYTVVSYKYIGGRKGRRSSLRDFPPDPPGSRIDLGPGGTRGTKAICVLEGALGQAAIPEVPSERQQSRCRGALIPWRLRAPPSPKIPGYRRGRRAKG